MKRKHFFAAIDEKRITSAIAAAEKRTSGRIRVFVSHHRYSDVMPAARRHFRHLGMDKTHHRNAVLIFVAPESQTFALLGDVAIHEKVGDEFWRVLRDQMVPEFKAGRYTEGIVHAIGRAGELLAAHFPAAAAHHSNEPPNAVGKI